MSEGAIPGGGDRKSSWEYGRINSLPDGQRAILET
jgi:hypothetical protein